MQSAYETAIGMYERAFTILARRADAMTDWPSPIDEQFAQQAEQYARPEKRLPESHEGPPQLRSIMGELYGGDYPGYYRPQTISRERIIPEREVPGNLVQNYQALWEKFKAARTKRVLSTQSPQAREANLHALLHRFGWAAAAPLTGAVSDTSLYDYTRVSAALAVCMRDRKEEDGAVALLVGGDVSGVQDWLYTLSSQGAAKSLRGRSFYLQLLSEVIAFYILDELSLPMANLLYVGGGNFYLLIPTAKQGEIPRLRQQISHKLLTMHDGALYVAIANAELTESMLLGEGGAQIGQAWDMVNRQLNRFKAQRFAELDEAEMAQVIGAPMGWSGDPLDTCSVCQRSIGKNEKGQQLDDGSRKCDQCVSFETLGNQLRNARFLVLSHSSENNPQDPGVTWQDGMKRFGYDVQLLPVAAEAQSAWRDNGADLVRIFYWRDDPDITAFPGWPGDDRTVWAFRPLAQATPINKQGEIATFDQFVSEGIPRWGVLRMDVDNLGEMFRSGIPANNLSRVVGVSSLLRMFFEGYVPLLAESFNRTGQPAVYLMYAGGDDLFIVGGWSWLPTLAADIQQAYTRFACNNPKLTISGGIALALSEKYPLYQAAEDAGQAEAKAKAYGRLPNGSPEKNALALLDEVMTWKTGSDDAPRYDSYQWVHARMEMLRGWLQGDQVRRSLLMTLRAIDGEWREWKKREQGGKRRQGIEPAYLHTDKVLYLGPWAWHLVYSLARAQGRVKNTEIRRKIQALQTEILGGGVTSIGLVARWAELATRETASDT